MYNSHHAELNGIFGDIGKSLIAAAPAMISAYTGTPLPVLPAPQMVPAIAPTSSTYAMMPQQLMAPSTTYTSNSLPWWVWAGGGIVALGIVAVILKR